jgi:hypothetical protein
MSKISPLFKWFGSKWSSAKKYPCPDHPTIIEPFAGSAGYSLNYAERNIVLWEDDQNLFQLWNWLINQATTDDILKIPVNLPVGTNILKLQLSKGQALLLKHWQRTNNVGDCWTISSWGNLPGQWTRNTRARVADEVHAIKHWKLDRPIHYIDKAVTWFIDPPYLYNYQYSNDLDDFNHQALDSLVQTIAKESLVIVCEARRKSDGKIPDYLPFQSSHESVTSRRKLNHSHHSKEVLYIRYPS